MNGILATLALLLSLAPPGSPAPAPVHAVWPLDPRPDVVAGFEPPDGPFSAGHRGVDLLGTVGEPVRSALAGTVTFAGSIAGRGVVVVDHGRFRTTYEPVAATEGAGTTVRAGQVIGRLQAALGHCPPRSCLHWGLIEGADYRDPLSLFGQGPVRLLPLRPAGAPGGTPSGGDPW